MANVRERAGRLVIPHSGKDAFWRLVVTAGVALGAWFAFFRDEQPDTQLPIVDGTPTPGYVAPFIPEPTLQTGATSELVTQMPPIDSPVPPILGYEGRRMRTTAFDVVHRLLGVGPEHFGDVPIIVANPTVPPGTPTPVWQAPQYASSVIDYELTRTREPGRVQPGAIVYAAHTPTPIPTSTPIPTP